MYNRNDNAYGDERRRWNADDRYTQPSRYQDTGISSGLRGNDYQSRQSLMSTNYDDIRSFNANSGRVALLQENEMRRQETLERRSDSYGSGGQYGGFRERGDRPRKSVYDEGPYHRQETERYPPRREEPLRGRGLLGEPEQQFLRPQPNMVHQMESEAKLALANTLINALVQSQQQPVLPTPAPLMAQPLMNASLFGGGVRGRRDEPRYRRDEARGYGQKMTRKEFGDRRRDEKPYDRKKNIQAKQTPSRGKAGDKENGKKDKTPSKGARQGKDEEDNTPYKGLPKRYFFCHLCYKEVWNGPSFERHLKGAMHNDVLKRTEEVHNARIESLRLLSQLQEEKREKNNDRRYVPGAMQHCNMCDADFSGSLFRHRKSKTHLALKAFIHPKCYMCNEDFHSRIDRDEHFLTAKHLKKLYEFEGDDLVPKTPQEAEKAEVEVVEVEEYDPANPTEEDESKSDQAKAKDDKILPKLAPKGRTIYHCNVCNLYFSHVEMVYDRHCRTEGHHDHYGYAIAVRNDIKVEEEEEGEKEDQEEEKTAEKKDGDDDGSDDDGNWKRRGTKKRDETDNDEYNSQEARSEEKEEVESSRKRDRTDSEKEEEGVNPKIQKVEMKEDIPGAETTSIKKEEMDSSQNKGADSGKVEEGLNQEVKAKEEIPVVEVTKKEKSNVVKTGNEETASDSGTPIAETESETSQPKVEEKTSDESKEEKTSKPTAAKPKPGPKTAKNLPAAKGPVKTPAKVAPSLGTKKPGPASKTVQPQAKKAAVVNKPAPASVKGVKKGATATPQAANGAAKGKGAAS